MRDPAAPPTPEGATAAISNAPASGRSRHSWKSSHEPHRKGAQRVANRPLREGLTIRPADGYSCSYRHMWALTRTGGAEWPEGRSEKTGEATPVFRVKRPSVGGPRQRRKRPSARGKHSAAGLREARHS